MGRQQKAAMAANPFGRLRGEVRGEVAPRVRSLLPGRPVLRERLRGRLRGGLGLSDRHPAQGSHVPGRRRRWEWDGQIVCVCVCVCAEHQIYPDANFSTCRGLEPARGVSSQRRRPPVSGSKRTFGAAPGPLSRQLAGPPPTKVPFLPFSPKPAEPQLYSRLTSCTRTMRDSSVVLETHQLYSND